MFHSGTRFARGLNKEVVTDGGRVVCVTALGKDLAEARGHAYSAFDKLQWEGRFCRRDIGLRHLTRKPSSSGDGTSAPQPSRAEESDRPLRRPGAR